MQDFLKFSIIITFVALLASCNSTLAVGVDSLNPLPQENDTTFVKP